MKLFKTDTPVLLLQEPSRNLSAGLIRITRPSRYSNPFKIGYPITKHDILSCIYNKSDASEEITDSYISTHFPNCLGLIKRGGLLSRSDAILAFKEHWGHLRYTETISDSEVLSLSGKDLLCCCKGKACHGDIIIEDYRKTKFKKAL